MINEKYKTLIDKIISNTKNKTIKWEQTSSDSRFKTKIGLGAITIEKNIETDINGNVYGESLKFAIINNEGIEADYIFSENIPLDNDYDFLLKLYETARDSYLKINDTVQSMLDELNSLEEFF